MKRVIALSLALICVMGMTAITAMAAEEPVTKTEIVNVARGKDVSVFNLYATTPYLYTLTDGDTAYEFGSKKNAVYNAMGSYPDDYAYFQIDLVNRCMPQSVDLYLTSVNADTVTRKFQIIGSNTADFAESVVLYDASTMDFSSVWTASNSKLSLQLENSPAIRYIRYQQSQKGVGCGLAEFEVYAQQTVTDLARNTDVSANRTYLSFTVDKAVNGTNLNENDCWYANIGNGDIYAYLLVDLKNDYLIDRFEIEARNVAGNTSNGQRKNYNIYGATEAFSEDVLEDVTNANLPESEDYTCITTISAAAADMIPEYHTANNLTGHKTVYVNDVYRYFLIRKTTKNEGATVGQFRAYAVNPTLNTIAVEEDKVTISFNHEINEASLPSVVTNEMDEPVEVTYNRVDECTYSFNIAQTETNDIYYLDLSSVTDNYGLPLYSDIIEFQIEGQRYWEATDFQFKNDNARLEATVKNTGVDADATVWLIAAFYKADGEMYKVVEARDVVSPGNEKPIGLDIPSDEDWSSICGYLWSGDTITRVYNNFIKINK